MFKQPTTQQAVISIQMTPEQFERIEKMFDLIAERTKPKEEKFLTIKQVAELLGVTEPTLWRWNKEGILKRVKVGNKVRYKESDVNKVLEEMAWLQKQRQYGPIALYCDIDNDVKKATVMPLEWLKNKTTIKSEIKWMTTQKTICFLIILTTISVCMFLMDLKSIMNKSRK